MKNKATKLLAIAFGAMLAIAPLSACKVKRPPKDDVKHTFTADDYLTVNGTEVVNQKGANVKIRGVNAGGLFVTENWMNGFSGASDYYNITNTWIQRFGVVETQALWQTYRENYWSDIDFKNVVDMGVNTIRLPFSYMNVDFDAVQGLEYAGQGYDFTALDAFVNKADEYGLYVILDLHGAYGSQNGKDHSGQVLSNVDFYSNQTKMDLTVKLWGELSKHYKNNPTIAAYDILNEPGEDVNGTVQATTTRHFNFFDRVYDTIREQGDEHIVMFESCWGANDLPATSRYGWENCIYQFHHYTGESRNFEAHCQNMSSRLTDVTSANFGVPVMMGEFTCYNVSESWDYTLQLLNAQGWHWTNWTYKITATSRMPWGVINVVSSRDRIINVNGDDYETILQKMSYLKTTEQSEKFTFGDRRTLFDIIKANAKTQNTLAALEYGGYQMQTADQKFVYLNGSTLALQSEYNTSARISVGNAGYRDGAVYLSTVAGKMVPDAETKQIKVTGETARRCTYFAIQTQNGVVFLSEATYRYVRYDANNGVMVADASFENATHFTLTKV